MKTRLPRHVRLAILAALVLAGCGDGIYDGYFDVCPGTPCAGEGLTVDMFPGCAICRGGEWVNEYRDNEGCVGMGYPHQCAAGLPSKLKPSACTFERLVCK